MDGTSKPDYARCVDISTAALKEMLAPGLLAITAPLAVGIILGTDLGECQGSFSFWSIGCNNDGNAGEHGTMLEYIEEGHFEAKAVMPKGSCWRYSWIICLKTLLVRQ